MPRCVQWLLLQTPIRRYWCWAAVLASSDIALETLYRGQDTPRGRGVTMLGAVLTYFGLATIGAVTIGAIRTKVRSRARAAALGAVVAGAVQLLFMALVYPKPWWWPASLLAACALAPFGAVVGALTWSSPPPAPGTGGDVGG